MSPALGELTPRTCVCVRARVCGLCRHAATGPRQVQGELVGVKCGPDPSQAQKRGAGGLVRCPKLCGWTEVASAGRGPQGPAGLG